MGATDEGPAPADIWQTPDALWAEQRVRELERTAAQVRASQQESEKITAELEAIHDNLALARIDLSVHRAQRETLERELERRRSEDTIRQRREVVELFEGSVRRLEAMPEPYDDDITRRLDAIRLDLQVARRELERAVAERRAIIEAAEKL